MTASDTVFVLDLELAPGPFLRTLAELHPVERGMETVENVTYLDTFDWRLFKAGATLLLASRGSESFVRLGLKNGETLEEPGARTPAFASDLPPGDLRTAARKLVRHRRLFPTSRARWETASARILDETGAPIVQLSFRRGVGLLPGEGEGVTLDPRLVVSPIPGSGGGAKRFLPFLEQLLELRHAKQGEHEAVLGALGRIPGWYSSTFELTLPHNVDAAHAARAIHRTLLEAMLANLEGVIRDWDREFLHDLRVAVRRTRSALSQLRGVFPPDVEDHFSAEFRWLGARSGPVRDIDVFLLNIPAYRKALGLEAASHLDPVVAVLKARRRKELRRLRAAMRSRRWQRLQEEWQAFLNSSQASGSHGPLGDGPAREIASDRIWAAFEKVVSRDEVIDGTTAPEILHRLRLDCKKLRYLMTFFQSLYRKSELKPPLSHLKKLQDRLGSFNDLRVQEDALAEIAHELIAGGTASPATVMAMGRLMGQLEERRAVELDAFHGEFGAFCGEENRARFRELVGKSPPHP